MDVVRLGERYTTSYLPDELVEGYSSCIWTERFTTPGEFEIKTPHIRETRLLLPEDTLISHLDTDEVMMVETHDIATNEEGVPELVVRGRDIKGMLDHRWIESNYQKKRKMRKNYSAVDGLAVLLWNAFDNSTTADVTRGDPNPWDDDPANNNYTNADIPKDRIPNIAITDSVPVDGAGVVKGWWLTEGLLAPQFIAFANKYDIGLRAIRPGSGSDARIVSVATALATRGTVSEVFTNNITALRFDLYKGVDRSQGQSVNPKVSFSTLQGDLSQAQYLWSKKDYKTLVEIISSVAVADQARNATERAYTGWQRRLDVLDAGSPDIPPEPERPKDPRKNATQAEKNAFQDALDAWREKHDKWVNKKNAIIADFKADAIDDAAGLLKLKRRVAMLSGTVSTLTPFQFKEHYGLGDKVSIVGDYDMAEDMIVEEYVRTDDENGDRGYPGLVVP